MIWIQQLSDIQSCLTYINLRIDTKISSGKGTPLYTHLSPYLFFVENDIWSTIFQLS